MNNQPSENLKPETQPEAVVPGAPPVNPEPVVSYSNAVISDPPEKQPVWFYFLFIIIALIFFLMTYILAKTILDKQKQLTTKVMISPSPISQPPKIVSPTLIPTPADQYLDELNKTNESDDLVTIESELEKTNTKEIKGDFDKLDAEVNL